MNHPLSSGRPGPSPRGACPACGKLMFDSRKVAKAAARRAHPGERLNAYQCGDWWHYGHLMPYVKVGDTPRPAPRRRAS